MDVDQVQSRFNIISSNSILQQQSPNSFPSVLKCTVVKLQDDVRVYRGLLSSAQKEIKLYCLVLLKT